MKKFIPVLLILMAFSCEGDQKITQQEMKAYEKDLKEKIRVAKVEIVQMKLDMENLSDSLATDIHNHIRNYENKLDGAEETYNSFKNTVKRDIWNKQKAKLDSTLGYLQLQIDSTKINIKESMQN